MAAAPESSESSSRDVLRSRDAKKTETQWLVDTQVKEKKLTKSEQIQMDNADRMEKELIK